MNTQTCMFTEASNEATASILGSTTFSLLGEIVQISLAYDYLVSFSILFHRFTKREAESAT